MKYLKDYDNYIIESAKQGKEYVKQGKISQNELDDIIDVDPTPTKKFVGWLSKQYIYSKFNINDIKLLLTKYITLINRKSINPDINSFKSLPEFKRMVDLNFTISPSLKELENSYDIIVDNDDILLIRPNAYEASRKLGLTIFKHRENNHTGKKDSAWCTTFASNSNWNKHYYNNIETIYYLKIKSNTVLDNLKNDEYDLNVVAFIVNKNNVTLAYDANDTLVSSNIKEELIINLNLVNYLIPHDVENRDDTLKQINYKLLQKEVIKGNITIDDNFLKNFDIQVNCKKIEGDIRIDKSLNFIPPFLKNIIVEGNFSCIDCKLTSLEGSPKEVYGFFNCQQNNLETLTGAPQKIGGDFNCSDNFLDTLYGSPKEIGGTFNCTFNDLKDLNGSPTKVNGDFICNNNRLITLNDLPKYIGGDLDYSANYKLPENPIPTDIKIKGKNITRMF